MPKQVKPIRRPAVSSARPRPDSLARRLALPAWQLDGLALIGLLALVLAFFWPVITGRAFFWDDFPEHYYPFRTYTAVELRAGRFPLWNPYLFGGIPFFAMIDTAVLYPLNWLFIPLVNDGTLSYLALEWHAIAHVFLSGAGMYAFCRSVDVGRMGAFAGGTTFMLSGVVVHQLFHVVLLNPLAWLPFLFLLFVRALDRLSLRLAVATGAVFGLMILAGHPQVFVYTAYAMGLYALVCLIGRLRSSGLGRDALRVVLVSVVAVGVGLGLAAIALLPMYELIQFSLRPGVSFEAAVSYSLGLRQLITLIMPEFFGQTDPTTWNYWGPSLKEYGHFWETYTYIGILPLLLAGVAIVLRRDRLTRFFGGLAVLALLLALGGSTPVYRLVYAVVPGIDKFRAPGRFGMIVGFAVAALVGLGLDALRTARGRETDRSRLRRYVFVTAGLTLAGVLVSIVAGDVIAAWLAGSAEFSPNAQEAMAGQGGRFLLFAVLSFGLLIAFLRGRRWNGLLMAAAAGLIAVDLFTAGYGFNLGRSGPEEFYPHDDLIQFIQQRQRSEGGRAALRAGPYMLARRNANLLFRIHTLEGYASPLRLDRTLPPIAEGHALDLMNVKYKIQVDQQAQTARLVPSPTALPRAFVVRKYVVARDIDAVARAMKDSTFNYRNTVTLDALPSLAIPEDSPATPEQPAITRYEPNRMTVSVTMTKPGILVVGEVYYPAWRAYIDGRPGRLYQADGTLRAVVLPAGRHTVEFRYESTPFRVGGAISAVSLLIVMTTALVSWKQQRG
ncbi:MAG: hypothetical protein HY710_00950 [Candidatus Latescibacteria bacterium]|nr:hypothetical protein [Candidatus Latescibacterota bacterium]